VGKRLSALGRHREDRSREHRGAPPRRCRTTVPPPACPRPTRSATPM
jgi:hypothetical protein